MSYTKIGFKSRDKLRAEHLNHIEEGISTLFSEHESDINILNNRISNIVANSDETGDNSELIDIRLDHEGNTHASAGDAVRSQDAKLSARIVNVMDRICPFLIQEIELSNGYFTNTNNAAGDFVSNSNYYATKVSVIPGEVYQITGVVNKYAYGITSLIVFINADNKVIGNILSEQTNAMTYTDYEFTIPQDCVYIGITSCKYVSTSASPAPVLKKRTYYDFENIDKNYQIEITDDDINIKTKSSVSYNFKRLGVNGLYQLNSWKIGNQNYEHDTDIIGPYYKLNAANNANGDRTTQDFWTGGCHGYNGNQTGVATAELISRKIIIDNVEIIENGIYFGNSVAVEVINGIQANNTCLENGGGRVVIREKITYTIDNNKIKVSNIITPLENITLEKYYGMQLACYTNYRMLGALCKDISNVGNLTERPELIVGYDDYTQVAMKMENMGMGTYVDNATSLKGYASSNKSYFCPINNYSGVTWSSGEQHYFVGEYIFGNVIAY